MLPLENERSKREAGRIVQRNRLVSLAKLYRSTGLEEKVDILTQLAEEFGCNSEQILQQCRAITEINESQVSSSGIITPIPALLIVQSMVLREMNQLYCVLKPDSATP